VTLRDPDVTQVTKIVINELLPTCGEMMWVEILLLVNEIFCILALLETCLAVKVAFEGSDTVEEGRAMFIYYWAKRLVPSAYIISLCITYSLDMDDGYSETSNPMWQRLASGVGAKVMLRPLHIIVPPLAIIGCIVVWKGAQRSAKLKK
jgi:hypothetical protein